MEMHQNRTGVLQKNKENKMMKTICFSMLMMAGLALTACSSDDGNTEPQIRKTYIMTVDATKGMNEAASRVSNRALSLTGSTLNASWATSEQVYVQGTYASDGKTKFWCDGFIQPQSAGETVRLNGTIALPDGSPYASIEAATGQVHPTLTLQFPRSGNLDYTGQIGTLSDIAANYDYATATISVDVINDRIVPYTETPAVFVNKQAIVQFTLKADTDGTPLLSPSALTVQYGEESLSLTIPSSTYTTNGAGVLFVAIPGFSDKKVILIATVGDNTYTFTKSGVTFENRKYYEISMKMKKKTA